MKTFFAWTVCLLSLTNLPAAARSAEPFQFTFRECDFSHMSLYSQDDRGYLPMLNDPLLVRGLVLAGADPNGGWEVRKLWFEPFGHSTGMPPLYHAANAAITRELLSAGADPQKSTQGDKSPLFFAPDAESARLLIEAGADVNAEDENRYTPIFFARNAGVTEVLLSAGAKWIHPTDMTPLHTARDAGTVKLLVKAGIHPNAISLGGYPPLVMARNADVARALIDAGAYPFYETPDGETLLFFARDADITRLLLAEGVNVNAVSRTGNTALGICATYDGSHRSLRIKMPEALKLDSLYLRVRPLKPAQQAEALIAAGADVNHRGQHDLTPLLMAYTPRLVALLLEKGADAAFQSGDSGITALHLPHELESVRRLLAAGASVEALDKNGQSPLFEHRDADITRLLLDAGASPTLRDRKGNTPLHEHYDPQCIRMLVAAGADPLAVNDAGLMPLDTCYWGYTLEALIDVMRQAGADPKEFLNDRRGDGDFLPFRLVNPPYDGNPEEVPEIVTRRSRWWKWVHYNADHDTSGYAVLRVLLAAGLDPNLKNDTGRTILFRLRYAATIRLMLEHGADAAAVDARGFTPLHLAVYNGAEPEAIKLLLEAGADPNAESMHGITPLECWCELRCDEMHDESRGGWATMSSSVEMNPDVERLLRDAGAK